MSLFNSPLFKIGVGAMTGGVGGAAMGALGSTNSPASKAFGAYNSVSNIANSWSSPKAPLPDSSGGADWSQNQLGGQNFSDQFGAMNRRMSSGWGR